jgi:hypothetical protein
MRKFQGGNKPHSLLPSPSMGVRVLVRAKRDKITNLYSIMESKIRLRRIGKNGLSPLGNEELKAESRLIYGQ